MKNRKRGQISVFVIIAVIIIVSVIGFFMVKNNNTPNKNISPEVKPIYLVVENCIKQTSEDSIYYIGQSGGYFILPNESMSNNIAYYFKDGKNLMPTKADVQKQMQDYVNNLLFFCVKNFEDYPDFTVRGDNINTSVKIENDKVIFNIKYPLTIIKNNRTYYLRDFKDITINSRLGLIYDFINELIEEQMKHPKDVCVSCIVNSASEKNLYVNMNDFKEEGVIFRIIDKDVEINNEEYVFYFGTKF